MKCPKCSKEIPDDAVLCPYCGALIKDKRTLARNIRARRKNLSSGIWLILIGGIFLIANFSPYDIGDLWPLFLIAIGLGLIVRHLKEAPEEEEEE